MMIMEKGGRIFRSFEEAEAATIAEHMRMSPNDRIELLLELQKMRFPDATEQRLAPVCRITQFEQG